MRILIGHNSYQMPGGEDAVVKAESVLLKDFAQDVVLYERSNTEIDGYSTVAKMKHFLSLGWSKKTYDEIRALIRKFKPEIAHFHNIFFMITPSAYFACKDERVPVVQSQHNFRLLCSNGLFYRNHRICEECLHKTLWRGVYHRCYKDSRLITAAVVWMLEKHWKQKTWLGMVDFYIVASEFTRQKYIEGGISPEKIAVKPNFVYPDKGIREKNGSCVLYVGRLSDEKGVHVLLKAWKSIKDTTLKIVGEGPMGTYLRTFIKAENIHGVEFLGYVADDQYEKCMQEAKFIVVPSLCYENFPRIIAEAYAYGIPIVASRLGSMEEIVQDYKTGLLFNPGDSCDLAQKIDWLLKHDKELEIMQKNAREEFEKKYAAQENYHRLMEIYQTVIK